MNNPIKTLGKAYIGHLNEQTDKYKHYLEFDEWRYYFDVTVHSVIEHIIMVLFPLLFPTPWKPKCIKSDVNEFFLPSSYQRYATELYTPLVSGFTFVIFVGLWQGITNQFSPEHLGTLVLVLLVFINFQALIIHLTIQIGFEIDCDFRDFLFVIGMSIIPIFTSMLLSFFLFRIVSFIISLIIFFNYFIFSIRWYCGRYLLDPTSLGSSLQNSFFIISLIQTLISYFLYLLI
ncbi:hypothetical protein ENUP19_0263G0044 [Entamoeba nuttalli]|uniref:Protein YIF1 n=2 Tax=Entamoeba nuttalli TaxID=412467 RepID=K2HQS2_ENTNP|nr:Hrf1 family protein [Entamoeba nuttalli P19]EKE38305.1 Hrf1 family protein [Entamoeba nuttalli P19]|eukprot:XP_008859363.1 Hrf1 family protein [Entamoeba nuttalli P19]